MDMMGTMKKIVERGATIDEARVLRHSRQRLHDVSEQLTRKGMMNAQVMLTNSAVDKMIGLVYQTEPDGDFANVDMGDYRLLIAAPWGKAGHRYFGLYPTEMRILNAHMRAVQDDRNELRYAPLFMYDNRHWYLNLHDYPDLAVAVNYWRKCKLSLAKWKDVRKTLGLD